MRALPEARTGIEPAGEIREGLYEQISHTDVRPKATLESRNCENLWHTISEQSFF